MSAPALHLVPPPATETPLDRLRSALEVQAEVVLSGCAGTGKTWHVQHLLDKPGMVLCAPTAKAAGRLKEVTGRKAFTVHSLIYGKPTEQWVRPDGEVCKGWTDDDGVRHPSPGCPGCACTARLVFSLPQRDDDEEEDVSLIVVDEASMVGAELARDIRRVAAQLEAKILWVGDPAQLPPVGDGPGVDLHRADVHLDHVYRQQGGILALATAIREAQSFADIEAALGREYDDVEVRYDGLGGLADWRAGRSRRMAIVHTNRQRVDCNAWVRQTLRRVGPLVTGDRVLIRKNARGIPVWNGEVYVVVSTKRVDPFTVVRARLDGLEHAPIIHFVVHEDYLGTTDTSQFGRDVHALGAAFRPLAAIDHHEDCTFFSAEGDDCSEKCRPGPLSGHTLVNAQHGFAITCHAAQGSEADEVGVLWTPYTHGDRFAEARSWLYTAVTRARRSLVIWTGR